MKLALVCIYTFLGAVFFAIPNITRHGMLFAVPIPAEFRHSPVARRSISLFRALIVAALIAILSALLFSPERFLGMITLSAPFILLLAGGIGFAWQHRQLAQYAVAIHQRREVAMSTRPDRLPWFTWLSAVPFGILVLCAGYLRSNWWRIPERFPVHWGADGQPNRWTERTTLCVYGPLLFAGELCLWFAVAALVTWHGSRRSQLRRAALASLVAMEFMMAILFGMIALDPLIHLPIWLIVLWPLVTLVPIVVIMMRLSALPGDSAEATPEAAWKWGLIYYNPDDPALMVEKRTGVGYTFNFARPVACALLGSLLLVIASAFLWFRG